MKIYRIDKIFFNWSEEILNFLIINIENFCDFELIKFPLNFYVVE